MDTRHGGRHRDDPRPAPDSRGRSGSSRSADPRAVARGIPDSPRHHHPRPRRPGTRSDRRIIRSGPPRHRILQPGPPPAAPVRLGQPNGPAQRRLPGRHRRSWEDGCGSDDRITDPRRTRGGRPTMGNRPPATPAVLDPSCLPVAGLPRRFRSPRVIVAVTAVGDGSWLTEVAQSACRDVGGVPVELLGDYLLLLADAAHVRPEAPSRRARRGGPTRPASGRAGGVGGERRPASTCPPPVACGSSCPWSSGPGTATPSVRPPRPCSTWCVRPSQPGRGIQRRPPTDGAVGGNPAQGGHHGFIVAITPADTDVPGPRTGPKTLGDLMLTELSRSLRGDLPLVRGAGLRRWRRPSLRSSRTAWSR